MKRKRNNNHLKAMLEGHAAIRALQTPQGGVVILLVIFLVAEHAEVRGGERGAWW